MQRGVTGIFGAGFLQGASFVLIPSLGPLLRAAPYHVSNSLYGMLYLPEIVGAILAALTASVVQARWGERALFRLGVLSNVAAMACLVVAAWAPRSVLIAALLTETGFLGIGFGLTNAAINRLAARLFAQRAATAVTWLNALIGAATALSPLALEGFTRLATWAAWPAVLGLAWLGLLILPQPPTGATEVGGLRALKASMAPFAIAVLIYAICEGSFGSWATVMVATDHHLPASTGALALALFWGGMTAGRFVLGALPERVLSRRLTYRVVPFLIAADFVIIPGLHGAQALILAFALAGVACAVYYPYSMTYGIAAHPQAATEMAGLLVGGLMVGEGIGSFGLGPLQHFVSLGVLYRLSALWAIPLTVLAIVNSRARNAA